MSTARQYQLIYSDDDSGEIALIVSPSDWRYYMDLLLQAGYLVRVESRVDPHSPWTQIDAAA
ncbi:hypothetical protein ACWIGI_28765 [Nocardia sp. NPDC055321]